ncbi:MAG: DUF192 domain-containing protein [Patescibacteria group bacterium]
MKKIYWVIRIIFIFLLLVFIGNILEDKRPTVTINKYTFNLYVAKTPKDREIGLSKYNNIPQNFGMIFLFDKPDFYSFWIKDMKFPIDIIFIRNGRIVTIHKNVKPPTNSNENPPIYRSSEPADIVLEINAGLSEKYNFKEGDVMRLDNV